MAGYLESMPLEERIDALPATIERLAAAHSVIVLPWLQTNIALNPTTTFNSSKARNDDPWIRNSPFDQDAISHGTLNLYLYNTQGSFKAIESSSSSAKEEHVSMSFSLSAGCRLLKASVSGQFDKEVIDSNDDRKLSKHATLRYGSIQYEELPRLSTEARELLLEPGGWDAFRGRYGDYWLVGYNLGADVTVSLSETKDVSNFFNHESLTVAVSVVGIKHEHKTHEFVQKLSSTSSWQMSAFDSLTQSYEKRNVLPGNTKQAMEVLSLFDHINHNAEYISQRVERVVNELSLTSERQITHGDLMSIGKAGFVVELVLRPLLHHRDVQSALLQASSPTHVVVTAI